MEAPRLRNPRVACIGAAISLALLLFFFVLQYHQSILLALPFQYLIVATVPVIVGLIIGGYIKELKAGDLGLGFSSDVLEQSVDIGDPKLEAAKQPIPTEAWQNNRAKEYERTHGFMLAHVYRPSRTAGQKFDISIFIVRHEKGSSTPPRKNLHEIEKAEFFFGESWGNRVFPVQPKDGFFGVRTHAWGTFLAACRVTFKDAKWQPIILYRYIDFSMADENN